jgi:hypothetical protein
VAMNPDTGSEIAEEPHPLQCGRSVEDVWAELEVGRIGEHTPGCPHCTTARASLEQLAEATRELVDDPVEPPPGLFDRILDAVRADLGASRAVPLPVPGVDISTHALAAVLRYAVDTVPGLRAHRCRVEPIADDPEAVRVWMSVSMDYHAGRVDALDTVRARIRAALSDRIGLDLAGLDLELVDLWTDGAPEAER